MPKKYKVNTNQIRSGFTLIELLVVISIIVILSIVGLVSFQGILNNTQSAKVTEDLNAIKKAYEATYDPTANGGQGGYKVLSSDGVNSVYFADGKLPKAPNGSPYPIFTPTPNTDNSISGFLVCPPGTVTADPSICERSDQGTWAGPTPVAEASPTPTAGASSTPVVGALPLIDQSFFNRKDILYSSEIGSWSMQGGRYGYDYRVRSSYTLL